MNPSPASQAAIASPWRMPLLIAALVVLIGGGYFGWQYFQRAPAPAETMPALAPAQPVAAPPALAQSPAEPPAIEHPVEPPASESVALPALGDSDAIVSEALSSLLSRKNLLSFLQVDGFVRRVVATVDNLPRSHAPAGRWPVVPTPQRFLTQTSGDGRQTIAADNRLRYQPLVQMIEAVDTAQAAALYRRLYPLFQKAYEELGFPDRYFNDRLVQVLDHLIATPLPPQPLAVTLVEVKGTVPSLRPWVRYEYADPALEAMSAGQKMLMRTGPDNQKRLQAKLKEVRQQLAKP